MPRNLLHDLQGDDRRVALEALRDKLAGELLEAEGRDAAVIAKELRLVYGDLDSLPNAREVSKVDNLAARRAARLSDPEDRPVA